MLAQRAAMAAMPAAAIEPQPQYQLTLEDVGLNNFNLTQHVNVVASDNAAYYDGTAYSQIPIFNWDGSRGAAWVTAQVDIWDPVPNSTFIRIQTEDANDDRIQIKNDKDAGKAAWTYSAGEVIVELKLSSQSDTESLIRYAITFSDGSNDDEIRGFINGVQVVQNLTAGFGAFTSGNIDPNRAGIGSTFTTLADPHFGLLRQVMLGWGYKPSPAEMATIDGKIAAATLTTADLDNLFGSGNWVWWPLVEEVT